MRAAVLVLLAAAATAGETAFVHVSVVPMDREVVLERQTVLVRDGRIAAVGRDVAVPKGATVIDGKGRYLMPGLADMHVHNWYEEEHVLFLARGVTSVRNLWGTREHLDWQGEVEDGQRLAPTIYTTGPILDGKDPIWQKSIPVPTPEDARRIVKRQHQEGYRAIKVYDRIRKEVYRALVEEARKRGMRVTGHVPGAVGIWGALEAKQDCVEHLSGYGRRFHETITPEAVRRTAEAGTWNCPTLVVFRKLVPQAQARRLRARPEMRYVPPRLRATWDPDRDFRLRNLTPVQFEAIQRAAEGMARIVRALHEKTRRILCGTDCGNPFVVAGWSLHEELALLVAAGLSPYEALVCATRNPAAYLQEPFGTVEPGKRADLLLVERNPLKDVAHAGLVAGVMVRGRWLPREELDRRLEEVARSYARPKQRFKELKDLRRHGEVLSCETTWNGLVVGEERFAIDAAGSIHAQRVSDPPWPRTETLTLHTDGTGRLTYRDPGGDFEAEIDAPKDAKVVWGYPTFAGWMRVRRAFAHLKEGEEASLDYRELDYSGGQPEVARIPLRVRREREPGAYTIWMTRLDAIYESRLVFDPRGRPLELVTELQQGTVRIRRVSASSRSAR